MRPWVEEGEARVLVSLVSGVWRPYSVVAREEVYTLPWRLDLLVVTVRFLHHPQAAVALTDLLLLSGVD